MANQISPFEEKFTPKFFQDAFDEIIEAQKTIPCDEYSKRAGVILRELLNPSPMTTQISLFKERFSGLRGSGKTNSIISEGIRRGQITTFISTPVERKSYWQSAYEFVRGSGRTNRQMQEAPKNAIYIVGSIYSTGFQRELALAAGRPDLKIESQNWIRFENLVGRRGLDIVIDHEVELDDRQIETLRKFSHVHKTYQRRLP